MAVDQIKQTNSFDLKVVTAGIQYIYFCAWKKWIMGFVRRQWRYKFVLQLGDLIDFYSLDIHVFLTWVRNSPEQCQ